MAPIYLIGVLFVFGFAQAGPDIVNTEIQRSSSRIVSGWVADEGQFPHIVSLRMVGPAGGVGACGGSILTNQWILTAAHCLARRFTWVVRFGVTNLTRPEYIVDASERYIHEGYDQADSTVQTHDIGLLKVPIEIPYGPNIQPIRIQSSERKYDEFPGEILTLSGFGRTNDWWNGGYLPDILYWVFLRGVTQEECFRWYPYSQVIKEQTICTMSYNVTNQGACSGDSGGALTKVDIDGRVTQIGIMSFGAAAGCNTAHPSGYVRPEWYHYWIEEVLGFSLDWKVEDLLN